MRLFPRILAPRSTWLLLPLLAAAVLFAPRPAAACELDTPLDFIGGCADHSFYGPVQIGFLGLWASAPNNFGGLAQVALKTYTGKNFYGLVNAGLSNDVGGRFVGLAQVGLGNHMGIGISRSSYDRQFLFGAFDLYDYQYDYHTPTKYGFSLLQAGVIFNVCGDCSFLQVAGVYNQAVRLSGIQAAVFMNNSGTVNGLQLSPVYNEAERVHGLQLNGVVGNAEKVRGAQVGLLNFAESVKGLQIGLYNQTQYLGGVQIGLMNLHTQGSGLPWMLLLNVGFH